MLVTLWCEVCEDEWDTLMTPEQASGDSDSDPELVTCPVCGQDGEWAGADGPDDGPLL